ncbi:hypothetical protein PV341_09430 [Streptomyces sp. PA03-1a]|nr:hypothetical protein [Streptomyces sp. PA03-1a]MDX2814666.1 hypothetical protein [Streptomyces sp. PA03-5A]
MIDVIPFKYHTGHDPGRQGVFVSGDPQSPPMVWDASLIPRPADQAANRKRLGAAR